ncbi:MAG: flagellar biosynthetic protein FliR [Simkaniaceae bacterium]|nr:flagellar biosynthetic protein FliR [Simkaniaceae bacterium]
MTLFDYLFTLPGVSWSDLLSLFFLALMRMGPIIMLAPFLGAKTAPIIVRTGLAVMMSVIFLPVLIKHAHRHLEFSPLFLVYSMKELLIGLFLGFLVAMPFYMVQSGGIIIDYSRGASVLQIQDPSLQNQASPIGIMYNLILITIFFNLNGPILFFESVADSYAIVPADGFINPSFFGMKGFVWETISSMIAKVIAVGIRLAAPSLVAILMAEMFLGIANRMAPQVQIAFLGLSIKSLLGLALLWAGWFFILKQSALETESWLRMIRQVVEYFTFMRGGRPS